MEKYTQNLSKALSAMDMQSTLQTASVEKLSPKDILRSDILKVSMASTDLSLKV